MSWQPPRKTEYIIARPEDHVKLKTGLSASNKLNVYAVQKALNKIRGLKEGDARFLEEDGIFGDQVFTVVKNYQRNRGLYVDGIAGPQFQGRVIEGWTVQLSEQKGLPDHLLEDQTVGESGDTLTAVNWSVRGGVDASATQRRVMAWKYSEPWPDYDAEFSEDDLKRAWDVHYQLNLSATTLRGRYEKAKDRDGTQSQSTKSPLAYIKSPVERAWRLAALYHNYPSAAENYSLYPYHKSAYWTTPQTWVTDHKTKFNDGTPVRTPFEWAQRYALGAPEHNHPGDVCKRVQDWTP